MKYRHSFRVHAPLTAVAGFHSRSASMVAITPPPVIARLHRAPAIQREGDEMDFTMWMGPVPIHWLAHIEAVSPIGFSDRQVRGPFREWIHRHTFATVDAVTTDVIDEVQAELRPHLVWGTIGLAMWLGLPLLFAYRAWKTKRLLERRDHSITEQQ